MMRRVASSLLNGVSRCHQGVVCCSATGATPGGHAATSILCAARGSSTSSHEPPSFAGKEDNEGKPVNGPHGTRRDDGGLDEDPAALLRRLQEETRARAEAVKDGTPPPPPPPPRRSGKTLFFDSNAAPSSTVKPSLLPREAPAPGAAGSDDGTVNRKQATTSQAPPSKGASTETNERVAAQRKPFIEQLTKMETDSKSPSFPTFDEAAERRRQRKEVKIKQERERMLVFRDVGMDLDKPILSRDVFLVWKYFRYGMEFAVDNELERQLRYFNEHAVNELKIIQGSKLMRGPPTLSRKRVARARRMASSTPGNGAAAGAAGVGQVGGAPPGAVGGTEPTPFRVTSSFPHVRAAPVKQFCQPFHESTVHTLDSLVMPRVTQSSFASFYVTAPSTASTADEVVRRYSNSDDTLFTTFSPSAFRRPAVVLFSQLGQRFSSEAEQQWRRLAYETICPAVLPYLPEPKETPPASVAKSASAAAAPAMSAVASPKGASAKAGSRAVPVKPIDVVSIRSVDYYKYSWVHHLYIKRFAKTLSASVEADTAVLNALLASTTFVGTRLLEPFYDVLGLRNYLAPYAMLVDHEGVIRWLSAGCPDQEERQHFPALLRQLEAEFYKSKMASGSG